jgi:hypothetical protein
MPLAKSPALTPGRFAAEGMHPRLRGNDQRLATEPIPTIGRTPFGPTVRKEFFFCYVQSQDVIENT